MSTTSQRLPQGIQITPVRAFSDNYIWCLHNDKNVVAVDPGDADPVLAFCKQNNLRLAAILITHHHRDHTGGIARLVSANPDIPVIGPAGGHIRGITKAVDQGDTVHLNIVGCEFSVIEVPGHTLDHIAFYGHGLVFCGDTLFSGGCGRLFEGSPAQMLHSLNKLKRLPDDTLIYCTHEYTQANMKFALAVEPGNEALQQHAARVSELRAEDEITLPSTLATEKAINPFLRSHIAEVKAAANEFNGQDNEDETTVFSSIRRWKDEF